MKEEELQQILDKHLKWLKGEVGGERANLYNADLSNANLRCANLHYANLYNANLSCANLYNANLRCANLYNANLSNADLRYADLRHADLRYANLSYDNLYAANLSCANLYNSNLSNADLRYANLSNAGLYNDNNVPFIPYACPSYGSFIGYKKVKGCIIKLEILSDAKRCSATGRKCRCNKAKVLNIQDVDGNILDIKELSSDYDETFIYKVGEIVEVKDFCEDRWEECSQGIHFFINRQEAVYYEP